MMPKTLAFVHTSPVLAPQFSRLAAELLPEVEIFHMVDESLIRNTIRTGVLTKDTIRRAVQMVELARSGGADAVMVTCSSIGPSVEAARSLFDFPVYRVDEAMAEAAVAGARTIGVAATLRTTLEPTIALLEQTAARMGRRIEIVPRLCEGAFSAVISGDTATHDRLVAEGLADLMPKVGIVVLAQASMARIAGSLPPGCVPVLSSPELAIRRVRNEMLAAATA
jgi:Asp/Glu/hydantoin racemase